MPCVPHRLTFAQILSDYLHCLTDKRRSHIGGRQMQINIYKGPRFVTLAHDCACTQRDESLQLRVVICNN
jgi:hypothetical protein